MLTEPMPSMPVRFWGDADGSRYRESYFDHFPGVWRHGDFFRINARGGCFVLGRSDATLNRHGVRIGTAEIYRSLAGIAEIEDSLIVNLDLPGGEVLHAAVRQAQGRTGGSTTSSSRRIRAQHPQRVFAAPRARPDSSRWRRFRTR